MGLRIAKAGVDIRYACERVWDSRWQKQKLTHTRLGSRMQVVVFQKRFHSSCDRLDLVEICQIWPKLGRRRSSSLDFGSSLARMRPTLARYRSMFGQNLTNIADFGASSAKVVVMSATNLGVNVGRTLGVVRAILRRCRVDVARNPQDCSGMVQRMRRFLEVEGFGAFSSHPASSNPRLGR